MMIWEKTDNKLVKLCNEFRKAVVAKLDNDPEFASKVFGAFEPEELTQFDQWSKQALSKSKELQAQAENLGKLDQDTLQALDHIVLDMSEKSAEVALRVLGVDTLREFIKQEDRNEDISSRYRVKNYPNLARLFAP
jgi:hypothetical protein